MYAVPNITLDPQDKTDVHCTCGKQVIILFNKKYKHIAKV